MTLLNDGHPFLTRQAADVGLTRHQLEEAIRGGGVQRLFRGAVVDSLVHDSRELRLEAAALVAPPHALVSGHFAAYVYGSDTFPPGGIRDLRPTFVVPHSASRPFSAGGRVRQTTIPDADVVEINGLQMTSPLRTATDLLRQLWRPYALAAADAMARAGVVDVGELAEYAARLRKQPGVVQARELAAVVDAGSESPGESWMRCRMLDAGLPRPTLGHTLTAPSGQFWRLDAAFVAHRVAAEYDGRLYHREGEAVIHDGLRRTTMSTLLYWAFVVATRPRIFGVDESFERELGALLGLPVLPRRW